MNRLLEHVHNVCMCVGMYMVVDHIIVVVAVFSFFLTMFLNSKIPILVTFVVISMVKNKS